MYQFETNFIANCTFFYLVTRLKSFRGTSNGFKKNHRFKQPIQADRSGLGMLVHKKGFIVKRIDDETAAAKSPLLLGDIITQFNGLAASPENIEKLRQTLSSNTDHVQICWISEAIKKRCDKLILEDRMKDHSAL